MGRWVAKPEIRWLLEGGPGRVEAGVRVCVAV